VNAKLSAVLGIRAMQISPLDRNNLAITPATQGWSFDNFPDLKMLGESPDSPARGVFCGVFHTLAKLSPPH
jgi:hypothetical protein